MNWLCVTFTHFVVDETCSVIKCKKLFSRDFDWLVGWVGLGWVGLGWVGLVGAVVLQSNSAQLQQLIWCVMNNSVLLLLCSAKLMSCFRLTWLESKVFRVSMIVTMCVDVYKQFNAWFLKTQPNLNFGIYADFYILVTK